jgi:hypothetical protein
MPIYGRTSEMIWLDCLWLASTKIITWNEFGLCETLYKRQGFVHIFFFSIALFFVYFITTCLNRRMVTLTETIPIVQGNPSFLHTNPSIPTQCQMFPALRLLSPLSEVREKRFKVA